MIQEQKNKTNKKQKNKNNKKQTLVYKIESFSLINMSQIAKTKTKKIV